MSCSSVSVIELSDQLNFPCRIALTVHPFPHDRQLRDIQRNKKWWQL